MAVGITVATATKLDPSTDNEFFEVTFTNTNAFNYAAGNIYYYALLTDSTSGAALTREVTFTVTKSSSGTINANTPQTFNLENTTNLVPTITGSDGKICYVG